MLFTDRDIITLTELSALEPAVQSLVTTEGLPASGEAGIIRRAISECASELMALMQSHNSYPGANGISDNHLAALYNVYGTRNLPRIHLSQICVNPRLVGLWPTISLWVGEYVLGAIYIAAWNKKKEKSKYDEKAEEHRASARRHMGTLRSEGLPIVWSPLARPAAALGEVDPGTWTEANCSSVAGAGELGGNFSVQVTWVGDAYISAANKQNSESHPSEEVSVTVPSGFRLHVDISSLYPPGGHDYQTYGLAGGVTMPRTATRWNLYVNGRLQNTEPIPVATKTYTLSGDPSVLGTRVGIGQHPDVYSVMPTGVPLFRG